MRNTKDTIAKWYLDLIDTYVNLDNLDNHNKLQKLHNTYWRNCHGFLFNYIYDKYATCMFMAYAPIIPLVSFWQHSIHKNSTNHIRAGGPGDNSIPPANGYLSKSRHLDFTIVKSNRHHSGWILTSFTKHIQKIHHSKKQKYIFTMFIEPQWFQWATSLTWENISNQ